MALTNTAIQNAKAAEKPYKLYDTDGLFMQVTPAGGKWWRFKYRFEGKEKLLSLDYIQIELEDFKNGGTTPVASEGF